MGFQQEGDMPIPRSPPKTKYCFDWDLLLVTYESIPSPDKSFIRFLLIF